MFEIQSKPVAHMVAQIRVKQLATRDSQNVIINNFVEYCEDHPDMTDAEIGDKILKKLQNFKEGNNGINKLFEKVSVDDIGYPVKYQKTTFQLGMIVPWAEKYSSQLASFLKKGQLYHNLTNDVPSDTLPMLSSKNTESFWGNENASVSSIFLATVATVFQTPFNMPGAATVFPFMNSKYRIPSNLIFDPFILSDELALFGGYQYGGHRYFAEQLLLGSEDCSSAVAKAVYLTNAQVKTLNTREMTAAFNDPNNEYKLKSVVKLDKHSSDSQLKLIQPGDLYLKGSHTAVISSRANCESEIVTVQFNRDLESSTSKMEGGGVLNYNLKKLYSADTVYILRADVSPLGETYTLSQFLRKIDENYKSKFPAGPVQAPGDCRIFFED